MREFKKSKDGMKTKMFLNLTYAHKLDENDRVPSSITAVLDSKFGFELPEDKDNLRKIFGLLHDPIMKHHYDAELKHKKLIPRMTPAEFCEYCIEHDNSLLLKLMYALTTGKMQFSPSAVNSKHNREKKNLLSEYLAVCVAKCMIERVNSTCPGPLQFMIGDMLSMVNAPTHTKEFLSKI